MQKRAEQFWLRFGGVLSCPTSWGAVVAASPHLDLFVSILFGSVRFISTLQVPVVPLVQSPAFLHRDPKLIELFKNELERLDTPFQQRCVGQIVLEPMCPKQLPCLQLVAVVIHRRSEVTRNQLTTLASSEGRLYCFLFARHGKIYICPSSKYVFEVVQRLPMANECKPIWHGCPA